MALPQDWQTKASTAINGFKEKGPVFGVLLPIDWRAELGPYIRDGQLSKMFGVRRIGFDPKVKDITLMKDPRQVIK